MPCANWWTMTRHSLSTMHRWRLNYQRNRMKNMHSFGRRPSKESYIMNVARLWCFSRTKVSIAQRWIHQIVSELASPLLISLDSLRRRVLSVHQKPCRSAFRMDRPNYLLHFIQCFHSIASICDSKCSLSLQNVQRLLAALQIPSAEPISFCSENSGICTHKILWWLFNSLFRISVWFMRDCIVYTFAANRL